MKKIRFSKEKDKWLRKVRKVGFEEVIKIINEGQIIDEIDHPKRKNQKFLIIRINDYIHVVPFVESEREIFLKTIYKSRKFDKHYTKNLD